MASLTHFIQKIYILYTRYSYILGFILFTKITPLVNHIEKTYFNTQISCICNDSHKKKFLPNSRVDYHENHVSCELLLPKANYKYFYHISSPIRTQEFYICSILPVKRIWNSNLHNFISYKLNKIFFKKRKKKVCPQKEEECPYLLHKFMECSRGTSELYNMIT